MNAAEIKRICAAEFGVSMADINSERRGRRVALPRQVAMYLCCRHTPYTYTQIGRAFDRDHTTIQHGARLVGERIRTDAKLHATVKRIGDYLELMAVE